MSRWKEQAEDRREELNHLIARLRKEKRATDQYALDQAEQELDWVKREIATAKSPDAVWAGLHRAEECLNELADTATLISRAEDHARRNLPDNIASERLKELAGAGDDTKKKRIARAIVHEAHSTAAGNLASLRYLSRLLWLISGVLAAAAVGLVLIQSQLDAAILPEPEFANGNTLSVDRVALLALVMGFGALGGLLAATMTFVRRTKLDDTRWFDPKPALTALKAATGAWFAVVGVMAVATGALVSEYSSLAAVLLLAIGFGYSQQVVTRLFDSRAEQWAEPSQRSDEGLTAAASPPGVP